MFASTLATNATTDNSVITATRKRASQQLAILERNKDTIKYEAQIFDLRALTNYTFQVKVLRFSDEPAAADNILEDNQQQQQRRMSKATVDRSSLARHLTANERELQSNELVARIETKPFRAEATKCLADVSEVVITTGKYFGGRISVENSLDKRCQLLGNKSSEQTSYTFKIDHEICHSKVVVSCALPRQTSFPRAS